MIVYFLSPIKKWDLFSRVPCVVVIAIFDGYYVITYSE